MATENKDVNKDDKTTDNKKSTLSLGGTLGLKTAGAPKVRSNNNSIKVEVKRKRTIGAKIQTLSEKKKQEERAKAMPGLTENERVAREQALEAAQKQAVIDEALRIEQEALRAEEEKKRAEERAKAIAEGRDVEAEAVVEEGKGLSAREKELQELASIRKKEDAARAEREALIVRAETTTSNRGAPSPSSIFTPKTRKTEGADRESADKEPIKKKLGDRNNGAASRSGRLTVNQAMNYEYELENRQRSLAAQRRARQKANRRMSTNEPKEKQMREVTIPETITVQELGKRMTEKASEIIKSLMGLGIMATINQSIDADTAELVVTEFGHTFVRVTDADVELSIEDIEDENAVLTPRAPVVTIMGHVDHGKTSILDSFRKTNVVSGEAGGITQHIGAYQIENKDGQKITFLDTPGHAAFTEMRARGANVTDVVILVVAANDSVMPQTIEAIRHAKAADVPIIVAINKCDLPDANPKKVKEELLQHEVIVEDYSGDVQAVEVSAKTGEGLDALKDAIILQAEILELKANSDRAARGSVVESKLDKGRGAVATVLIQKGTLRVGDIFISGAQWGRVKALVSDQGKDITEATPSVPVEVLGAYEAPGAGDDFVVVASEVEAREITEYRARKIKEMKDAAGVSTVDQLFARAKEGEKKVLTAIIKADVHGSIEAITGSLAKLTEDNDEVEVKVLHSGVGEITEADVTLANASNAMVIGFNVRANAQARDKAKQSGCDIKYYSIIYNIIDDARALLSGLLAPTLQEDFVGYAQIRQVFNITKVGKVAGCMITSGVVRRGLKVRLLRDNIVVHEGTLKTLKREKEEVKEVREGMECGMAFENYDDIKDGDMIECFEIQEIAREL